MWKNSCDILLKSHLVLALLVFPQLLLVNSEDASNKRKIATTTGTSAINGTFNGKSCNAKSLDECWAKLPSMNEPKIPTTSKEVDIACKSFDIGMDCVNEYSIQCLTQKQRLQLKSSVRGAHETFAFLCKDQKFRAEFLSHSKCYAKISRRWDDCAGHFIGALKRADQREALAVCCIRLRFLQCVTEISRIYCNKDAERFLVKMAETLVSTKMKQNGSECAVSVANCSQSSGAVPMKSPLEPSTVFAAIVNMLQFPSRASLSHFVSDLLKLFPLLNEMIELVGTHCILLGKLVAG